MNVITIEVEAEQNGWFIFVTQHARAFGGWSGGRQLWDHINLGDHGDNWVDTLPALRKSLNKAAFSSGIVLRPRTVESIGDDLAVLFARDENVGPH